MLNFHEIVGYFVKLLNGSADMPLCFSCVIEAEDTLEVAGPIYFGPHSETCEGCGVEID